MNSISEALSRAAGQLLGRASGPFHLRLVVTPALAMFFAIRTGLRDAREGHPAFLWEAVRNPDARHRLRRSWTKDIGKMIVVVLAVDTLYQLTVLHTFYPLQALLLVVVLAMAPYAVTRGVTTRVARAFSRKKGDSTERARLARNRETGGTKKA
jgi:hypothetical protein